MRLRMLFVATAAVLVAPSAAAAQGTTVGGPVFSSMELMLDQPHAFPAFAKAKTSPPSFAARATAPDAPTLLSVADGDATGGAKLGHLSVRGKRLADPLEATVGAAAFQPLDQSVVPPLTKFTD